MSSDLVFQHQSTPPSPASSLTNSLDDQVNNSAARVYFGPIQSPEKILIAEAAHSWNNSTSSPVCLSPQILSPRDSHPPLLSSEEEENSVREILEEGTTDVPTLATATLDEDCLEDDIELEPTSALATKISRSHDNPSPPPQMQLCNDDPLLLTLSEHHISSPAGSSSAIAEEQSRKVPVHPPSPASHEPGGSLDRIQTTSPPTNDSADLIIFDVSNLPNIPLASPVVEPFPDLLAPTPLRGPAPLVRSADSISGTPLFSPRIGSDLPQRPRDEELGEDHLSHSKVAIRSHTSNPLESPTQLCRSVSRVRSSPPRPISPSGVDPSTMCLPPVDTHSSAPSAVAELPPPSSHSRELRSLSPTSEGVLHNLLSTVEDVTTIPLHQIPALVSVPPDIHPPHDWTSTPERQSSPERPSSVNTSDVQRPPPDRSPWRNHITRVGSPNKFAFNNMLYDPNRTPTQRISIAQRPASPKKDSTPHQSSGIFGRPVFTRCTQEERTRSPVRPLPSDAVDRTAVASGISGSVVPERLRGGSEEPISPRRPPFPARSFLRSASDSEISSPSKSTKLPNFSIRPVVDASRLPDTIPEEHGPVSPAKLARSSPSRKSGLTSSTVGSRIPRIGAKPYARPIVKEKQQGKGNESAHKPAFVTKRSTPSNSALPKPVRLPVRLVNTEIAKGSKSGSEDFASSNPTNIGVPSSSQANTLTPQLSPSLKRKRSPEEMPSPPATQPSVARRVPPVPKVNQKSSHILPGPSSESGGPMKRARIGNVRKALGDIIPQKRATRSPDVQTSIDENTRLRTHSISPPSESQAAPPALPPASPPPSQSDPISSDVQAERATPPTTQPTTSPEPNGNFLYSSVEDLLSSVTPVTRSRRASQPTSDVFGAVRPLQQHRRRATQISAGGTFPSMSAVTLKALTNTNTARNQHNLAAILETEVIRKPGNRPGSPGTKVKTIDEKRKSEQGKERRERAERRARRASEPQEDSSSTSEDEATLRLGPDGRPRRHRRGPGDEEEYESPERVGRPRTRARIGEAGQPGEEVEVKTVRWDRGLFTMTYFDDLPLQSRTHDKSQTPATHTRGALARSAKALRLDSLGNLVTATSPLKDIVRENVTIKKYVYDDDAEAAELPDAPAPKPSSKGKGKKLKG